MNYELRSTNYEVEIPCPFPGSSLNLADTVREILSAPAEILSPTRAKFSLRSRNSLIPTGGMKYACGGMNAAVCAA